MNIFDDKGKQIGTLNKPDPIFQAGKWWEPTVIGPVKAYDVIFSLEGTSVSQASYDTKHVYWHAAAIPTPTVDQLSAIGKRCRDARPMVCGVGDWIWEEKALKNRRQICNVCSQCQPHIGHYRWILEDVPRVEPIKPKIICLCGSTRFTEQMLIKQWELTKQGSIVLSWCALPDSYFQGKDKAHIGDQEGVKEIVDEVHKRKIDLADEVLILNIDGYIGESTRSELEYARAHDKIVNFIEPETATTRKTSSAPEKPEEGKIKHASCVGCWHFVAVSSCPPACLKSEDYPCWTATDPSAQEETRYTVGEIVKYMQGHLFVAGLSTHTLNSALHNAINAINDPEHGIAAVTRGGRDGV